MLANCCFLQLLHHRTHRVAMLGRTGLQCSRSISYIQLVQRQERLHVAEKSCGILLGPQVDVQRM